MRDNSGSSLCEKFAFFVLGDGGRASVRSDFDGHPFAFGNKGGVRLEDFEHPVQGGGSDPIQLQNDREGVLES